MARYLEVKSNYYLPFETIVMGPFLLKNLLGIGIWIDEHEINATYDVLGLLRATHQQFRETVKNYHYGRFAYKQDNSAIKDFLSDGREEGDEWEVLVLFDGDRNEFKTALKNIVEYIRTLMIGPAFMSAHIIESYINPE